jgi:hypothetical protein
MIERSYNPAVMHKAFLLCPPEMRDGNIDEELWVGNHDNVMLVEDGDVGLATFEYPGVYTCHWLFLRRGRDALNLARRMADIMFTEYGAKALRGLTRTDLKAARWAARQLGMTSYGFNNHKEGEHELFIMTRDEFYGKA